MTKRTFFGLEIVSARGVRSTEIANLPFAGFWAESAVGSGQQQDPETGDWLVHLHDWKEFSSLFIATGRHQHMPRTPYAHWCGREEDEPDRTYFGLEVQNHQFVSKVDIAGLPFGAFWQEHCRTLQVLSAAKEPHLVHREDWSIFAKRFIETGA